MTKRFIVIEMKAALLFDASDMDAMKEAAETAESFIEQARGLGAAEISNTAMVDAKDEIEAMVKWAKEPPNES